MNSDQKQNIIYGIIIFIAVFILLLTGILIATLVLVLTNDNFNNKNINEIAKEMPNIISKNNEDDDNVVVTLAKPVSLVPEKIIDIVYSVTCHESVECVEDLVKNILFYNQKYNVIILFHTTPSLMISLSHCLSKYNNVFIPGSSYKIKFTSDIPQGHVENMRYCLEANLNPQYFIMLASNCMFHKMITQEELNQENLQPMKLLTTDEIEITTKGWWWPHFYQNSKVIQILKDEFSITCQECTFHEGMVLPINCLPLIIKVWEAIFPFIVCEFPWEEVIFLNVFLQIYKKVPAQLCRMDSIEPSPLNITECEKPIFKYCKRIYNDPVREWLRIKSNYYQL